jgi:chromate reductase, NAD(P)H dehydrogenase (quinone)
MASSHTVGVIVGSLRKDSYNRKVAQAAVALAPPSLSLKFIEIGDLPLYNADLETAQPPAAWAAFRQALHGVDAILFVTPEYNRSVPGVLKNAIDVGSRPGGKSSWGGKPCAVISVTQGLLGALAANHALRASFVFLNMPVMQQPEAYIGSAATLFDDKGELTSAATRDFLAKFMDAFGKWIARQLAP